MRIRACRVAAELLVAVRGKGKGVGARLVGGGVPRRRGPYGEGHGASGRAVKQRRGPACGHGAWAGQLIGAGSTGQSGEQSVEGRGSGPVSRVLWSEGRPTIGGQD